jgi:broad specificity phosphatase PhoE
MVKRITIIRHAQSIHNSGEFKTQEDARNAKLSEEGKRQASTVKGDFDTVVISPLRRAVETYARSSIKTRRLLMSELFREEADGCAANHFENEPIFLETKEQMRARAQKAKQYIQALDSNNIGIVAHGIFIWYFLEACGQTPIPTYNVQAITFEL